MFDTSKLNNLAACGGEKIFSTPKSTSNLLQPDIEKFLNYSRVFYDAKHYTNNGPNVRALEARLADFHKVKYCVTFSSGFWALAMSIRAVALKRKCEIVMPSLTYRRMADIAAWVGLKPRFCEVNPTTLGMTAATVEPCLNENTAVILGAHPIVNCCDVGGLTELSKKYRIPLVFDSVESVYESIELGRIGGFGEAECFSLHACKLLNGFGGGYLTTNNSELARELCCTRTFGFAGLDYVKFPFGLNAKLNEIHAAMTLASLDDVESQVARNRERYYAYRSYLKDIKGVRLVEFEESFQAGYKNIVIELLDSWPLSRENTILILNAENILARAYYAPPLHLKQMEFPYVPARLPETERLTGRYLNMPCGHLVSIDDILKIASFLRFLSENSKQIESKIDLYRK